LHLKWGGAFDDADRDERGELERSLAAARLSIAMRRYLMLVIAGVALATVGAVFAGLMINGILQYDACVSAEEGASPGGPIRPLGCMMPGPTGAEIAATLLVAGAVTILVGVIARSKNRRRAVAVPS
jgi:hypothetical protein